MSNRTVDLTSETPGNIVSNQLHWPARSRIQKPTYSNNNNNCWPTCRGFFFSFLFFFIYSFAPFMILNGRALLFRAGAKAKREKREKINLNLWRSGQRELQPFLYLFMYNTTRRRCINAPVFRRSELAIITYLIIIIYLHRCTLHAFTFENIMTHTTRTARDPRNQFPSDGFRTVFL